MLIFVNASIYVGKLSVSQRKDGFENNRFYVRPKMADISKESLLLNSPLLKCFCMQFGKIVMTWDFYDIQANFFSKKFPSWFLFTNRPFHFIEIPPSYFEGVADIASYNTIQCAILMYWNRLNGMSAKKNVFKKVFGIFATHIFM